MRLALERADERPALADLECRRRPRGRRCRRRRSPCAPASSERLTPRKSRFKMKFVTPASASAPYAADAPPVTTSTLRNSAVGKLSTLTRAVAIGRRHARAVEQDQRACRAHRAQIEIAAAGAAEQRAAAALRALCLEELRQLVELVRHRRAGLERLDLLDRDGRDGHGRRETGGALNARAGDGDLLELACPAPVPAR